VIVRVTDEFTSHDSISIGSNVLTCNTRAMIISTWGGAMDATSCKPCVARVHALWPPTADRCNRLVWWT